MTEVAGTWVDALLRTVAMLERLAVPYQIVGGAAAALYGVERPVHDIDLYVPARDLSRVAEACGERLGRPPGPHRDEHWDLTFLALEDSGLRVEIAGADAAYRDAHTGAWHAAAIDFDHATRLRVNQQTVRVMPIGQLVAYKRCLDRPVDRIDCAALDRARS